MLPSGYGEGRPTIESCYLANAAEFYFAERGDNGGLPVNPAELNPVTVHGLGPTVGIDFPHLLALMKAAVTDHQWGMFIIHGVGGDNLSASAEIFNNLANYLQQHSEIWCATFGDVVRYIQERKAIGIGAPESNDRRVQFKLRWTLDANL